MPLLGKRPQTRDRILVPGQRDVEIKPPRVLDELLRASSNVFVVPVVPAVDGCGGGGRVGQQRRGADREIREGPAGVGKDDAAPSVPAHDARHDHVDRRARRLVRVIDDGEREAGVDTARVDGVGRVHEDDGALGVEVPPDAVEVPVAEVVVVGPVAREEGDAVGAQVVQGAVRFGEGGVRFVEDGGEGGEEAVAAGGVGVADLGGGVVDAAGEVDGGGAGGDGHAGGGQG